MIDKIQKLKAKKGFTLVELIVVIAIIAILTAVIVPLVGRYSAQARYTTLKEAASEIQTSAGSAVSDANQIGVITNCYVTGSKGTGSSADLSIAIDGTAISATDIKADTSSGDSANLRLAKRLYAALKDTVPENSSFFINIKDSGVTGVVYTEESTALASSTYSNAEGKLPAPTEVKGFDYAYEIKSLGQVTADDGTKTGGKDCAVGAVGEFAK